MQKIVDEDIRRIKMNKLKLIKPKFIVDKNGKKEAVVLSYEEYKRILEDLEDLRDVAIRQNEPSRLFSDYHKERMKKK